MPILRPEVIKPFTQSLIDGELTRVAHILLKEGRAQGNVIADLVTDHGMTVATATDLVVRLIQQNPIKDTIRTGVRFDLPDAGDIITFAGERLWLPLDKPDNEPLERPAGDEVMITRCVPSAPNVCYIEAEFGGVTYGSDLQLDDGSISGIVKIVDGGVGGRPSDKAMARKDQRTRQAVKRSFAEPEIPIGSTVELITTQERGDGTVYSVGTKGVVKDYGPAWEGSGLDYYDVEIEDTGETLYLDYGEIRLAGVRSNLLGFFPSNVKSELESLYGDLFNFSTVGDILHVEVKDVMADLSEYVAQVEEWGYNVNVGVSAFDIAESEVTANKRSFVPDFRDVNIDGDSLDYDDRLDENSEAVNDALMLAPGAPGMVDQAQGEALSLTEQSPDFGQNDNVIEDSDRDKVMDTATGKRAQSVNHILQEFQENGLYPILTNYDLNTDTFYASFTEETDALGAGQIVSDMFDIEVDVDVYDDMWSLIAVMPIEVAAKKQAQFQVGDKVYKLSDPDREQLDVREVSDLGGVEYNMINVFRPSDQELIWVASDELELVTASKRSATESGVQDVLYDLITSGVDIDIDDVGNGVVRVVVSPVYADQAKEALLNANYLVQEDPEGIDTTFEVSDVMIANKKRSFTERQINRSKPSSQRMGSWWLVTAKEGDTVKQYVIQSRDSSAIKIKQASIEVISGPFANMQGAIDKSTDGQPTIMVSRRKQGENPEQGDYWTQNTETVGPVRAEDEDEEEVELDSYGVVDNE